MIHIIDRSQHPYKVGGRNLVTNNRTLYMEGDDTSIASINRRKITIKAPGVVSIWINTTNYNNNDHCYIALSLPVNEIKEGESYTLSMSIRTTGITDDDLALAWAVFGATRTTYKTQLSAANDGAWARYSVTAVASGGNILGAIISFVGTVSTAGATIEYKDLQIEYGPVATAFAYSPEEATAVLMQTAGIVSDDTYPDGPEIMKEDMDMDDMRQTGGYSSLYIVGLLPALIGGVRHG